MNFRIFGSKQNSIVDGSGIRLAIFFQGCLMRCKDCRNPGSWAICGGEKVDTEIFKKAMTTDPLLWGITLSGGEPFLQPLAALDLARFAHSKKLDVWCKSGYTFEEILEWSDNRKELLKEIDVLVDGTGLDAQQCGDLWRKDTTGRRIIDVQASLKKGEAVLHDFDA